MQNQNRRKTDLQLTAFREEVLEKLNKFEISFERFENKIENVRKVVDTDRENTTKDVKELQLFCFGDGTDRNEGAKTWLDRVRLAVRLNFRLASGALTAFMALAAKALWDIITGPHLK